MRTAEEILQEHIDKESMDDLSENIWPDMLDAMEEYAVEYWKFKRKQKRLIVELGNEYKH